MAAPVTLETDMSASAVLRRLARHGYWLDPNQPQAAEFIRECVSRTKLSKQQVADRLGKNPSAVVVAIRRQWFANVLWYSRPAVEVLTRCAQADPSQLLLDVLNLHEPDSRPPVPIDLAADAPRDSVVLDGDQPVAVGPQGARDVPAARYPGRARGVAPRAPAPDVVPASASPIWPRLDGPDYVAANARFDVVVGFAREAQRGVTGGAIVLDVPPGVDRLALTVVLTATGIDAIDGWSRPLDVDVTNPVGAEARFSFTARPPQGPEPVHLTTIEARYIRDGKIIGSASRPLVIGPATMATLQSPSGPGAPWLAQPAAATAIDLQPAKTPDLTIELVKPDRNAASGVYSCWLHTPHKIAIAPGPYDVDLGDDAKTFAKMVVDQLRQFSGLAIVNNLLESLGDLIAEKLPPDAFAALAEVAAIRAPDPPSVLIVSGDPYVPWELARLQTPLDAKRPPFLGAQVLLGRWLQEPRAAARSDGSSRPPANPPSTLSVQHMAVMAGQYRDASQLTPLPGAEEEAKTICTAYGGVALPASTSALKRLLDADLERDFERIGAVDAVHFAGHGEFDPSLPDSSVLYLSDGVPLSSILFRSAKYGGPHQPLLFLNACMIGIGGQLLGDMGGFPGNCLKGGFGGVLGALWEVDDVVAGNIAIEFWKRAMSGEPIGAILRDFRSGYIASGSEPPESTYLAYVYYGHPQLTLQKS